jgi:hypothetical protein
MFVTKGIVQNFGAILKGVGGSGVTSITVSVSCSSILIEQTESATTLIWLLVFGDRD